MNATTHPSQKRASFAQQVRRVVVWAIIVSFGVAALGGIAVLLSGAWSETAAKVLGTTALTGLFSVAVLCGATLIGKRAQWFGAATVLVAAVTLARLLWLLWADPAWSDFSTQFTATLCAVTGASAVASLFLLLVTHNRRFVRTLLAVTLILFSLALLLTLWPVWADELSDPEVYWRATGVIWILAALGIIVLPIISLVLRADTGSNQRAARDETRQPVTGPASSLSPDSVARIEAAAREHQLTPDELVRRLLP